MIKRDCQFAKSFPCRFDGRLTLKKARFLTGLLAERAGPVILALILLLAVSSILAAAPQEQQDDSPAAGKQRILQRVAGEWVQVGAEQYKRGYYGTSKKSFLKAQDYQEYLTADEREKLDELLERTDAAIIGRKRILEGIQKANELIEQGQLIESRAQLEGVQGNEFLTGEERELITEELEKVIQQLDERKRGIAELYDRSVGFYHTGQMEAARKGFLKISRKPDLSGFVAPEGETAEDYLVKIDNILVERLKFSALVGKTPQAGIVDIRGKLPKIAAKSAHDPKSRLRMVPKPDKPARGGRMGVARPRPPEPTTDKSGHSKAENRRRSILRSYTRAVVNDAIAKAQNYRKKGEFDRAKKVLEKAKGTVNKNRVYFGDSIVEQYSRHLEQQIE